MNNIKIRLDIKYLEWGQDYEFVDAEIINENSALIKGWPIFSESVKNSDIVTYIKNKEFYDLASIERSSNKMSLKILFKNKNIKEDEMYKPFKELIDSAEWAEKPFYLLLNLYFGDKTNIKNIENKLKEISSIVDFEYQIN